MQAAVLADAKAIAPAVSSRAPAQEAELLNALKETLKERPNDLNLHFKLALAYYDAGRPDEGIRRLNAIANHLADKGHYKTALSVNGSLLKLAPWHKEALSRREALEGKLSVQREIHVHPVRGTLLAGIPSDDLTRIGNLLRVERFPAETTVLREAETGRELYIVHSGSVNVFVSDRDRRNHALATIREGDFFGETAILTSSPRTASVQTRLDSEFWVLGYDECQRLMRTYPQVRDVLYRTSETRRQGTARRIRAQGIERRVFPRMPAKMPGHIEFQPPGSNPTGRSSVPVQVVDLSVSGAGLKLGAAPDSILARCAKGTPVALSFLVDQHSKVYVSARIERVRHGEEDSSIRAGVSFTKVSPEGREIINKYVTRPLLSRTSPSV